MTGFGEEFAAFERTYVKQRNAELHRDLQVAHTKLRFMVEEHTGYDIVPLPPVCMYIICHVNVLCIMFGCIYDCTYVFIILL